MHLENEATWTPEFKAAAKLSELGLDRRRLNEWRKTAEAGEDVVRQAVSDAHSGHPEPCGAPAAVSPANLLPNRRSASWGTVAAVAAYLTTLPIFAASRSIPWPRFSPMRSMASWAFVSPAGRRNGCGWAPG